MKHLTFLLACSLALCLSASAQFTPQQYPFPYNPDSNQDGMVSMTDFLEILGLFGQEYPNSFYSDSTRAVLDLGEIGSSQCMLQAEIAGTNWRMLTMKDVYSFGPLLGENAPYSALINGETSISFHIWFSARELAIPGALYTRDNCEDHRDCWVNSDSTLFSFAQLYPYGTTHYTNNKYHCFLVTEVRPTILYTQATNEVWIEELLNDGWQPVGNVNGFWKEAE